MILDTNEKFRAAIRAGKSRDEIIGDMKPSGLTIIEAIKATRELFSIDLGQAKQLVSQHPVWSDIANASAQFHESLIDALEDISTDKLGSK